MAPARQKTISTRIPRDAPGPEVSVETINPEEAGRYLECNDVNRAVRASLVERFTNVMLAGGWHLNGETIKFDYDGNLIDGQHRLMAVVEAGRHQQFVVVRNLPPVSRASIDTGARRTLADWLRMNGEGDAVNLATSLNWYYRLTAFDDPRIPQSEYPTYEQSMALLKRNPGLRDTVRHWRSRLAEVTTRGALMCALVYRFSEVDPHRAEIFAELLWTGADLSRGDPILVLRRFLARDRMEASGRAQRGVQVAAVSIKAFNLWRTGQAVASLSWRPGVEDFPAVLSPQQVGRAKRPEPAS